MHSDDRGPSDDRIRFDVGSPRDDRYQRSGRDPRDNGNARDPAASVVALRRAVAEFDALTEREIRGVAKPGALPAPPVALGCTGALK